MSYHPCVSGCGRFLAPQDGHDRCLTCLALSTLRKLSWMVLVLFVGTWSSRSCTEDSAMSSMAESLCLCRNPAFVPGPGAPPRPVESEVIWGLQWGLPQEEFLTPQALRSRWCCRWSGLGPLQNRVHHPFPSVLPLTTRCRSLHRRVRNSSRKCMRSLQDQGRHLSLPETNLVAPHPSPPSMVEPLWGTRASPQWSSLWPCNYVQQPPPLCRVSRVSPHGPVSIRQKVEFLNALVS